MTIRLCAIVTSFPIRINESAIRNLLPDCHHGLLMLLSLYVCPWNRCRLCGGYAFVERL